MNYSYTASQGWTSYGYDGVGNRQSSYRYQTGQQTNWDYSNANRAQCSYSGSWQSICPGGATSYGFDQNGNLTSRGADTMAWDGENRLTSATIGGTAWGMAYNGDGLRISRTTGGSTTSFLCDVASSLPTIVDDGSSQYLYGRGPGPLEQITPSGVYFFLPDKLGSTLAVTDSSGNVVQSYSYDAWGTVTASSGTHSVEYQFAGQQTDASGLSYMRARYYDPSSGRFLGRDPLPGSLENPLSQQQYSYAGNNPGNYSPNECRASPRRRVRCWAAMDQGQPAAGRTGPRPACGPCRPRCARPPTPSLPPLRGSPR
ncbi:MAG: RHS repeat domain-containing protein [Streptosporangiaceae bacterium]